MIDLVLLAVMATGSLITAFFIVRWDRKITKAVDKVDDLSLPYEEIGDTINNTLQSPEAMAALIDRAVSTAVLTWQRSNAGQLGGDARLAKGASAQVKKGVQQFVSKQNPIVGILIDEVMDFAKGWIGDDPDGKRSDAIWNQLISMGGSLAGQLDTSSLSQPTRQKTGYE